MQTPPTRQLRCLTLPKRKVLFFSRRFIIGTTGSIARRISPLNKSHRFHPASQTIKSIVDSGAIGKVKSVEADMALPTILAPKARDWSLGDGSFMNMGSEFSSTCTVSKSGRIACASVKATPSVSVATSSARIQRMCWASQ